MLSIPQHQKKIFMDYTINVNESNFSEVWAAASQMPVVFNFVSPREMASIEMDSLLRRLADEHPNQFLLATVNCDEQRELAMQFRIQAIPTMYLFADGQPVDMIQGAVSEQELRIHLANILPKEQDLKFNQALELLQDERYAEALPLLKSAWELSDKKNSDFALLYAESQIQLLEQAAESPELQQLLTDYVSNKTPEVAIKLANQLHQAGKNEEALTLLFDWLKSELSVANGELKTQFLAILSALGNDPIVPKFRRQLYSLLY